jgi:hypothetical protein
MRQALLAYCCGRISGSTHAPHPQAQGTGATVRGFGFFDFFTPGG